MRGAVISIAIMALVTDSAGEEHADGQLLVDVAVMSVDISVRPPGRRIIRLPGLSFALQIEPRCAAGMAAESIAISVADTRLSIGREVLEEQPVIETTIEVPQGQLAPLTIDNFCVADQIPASITELRVRDALTAKLSLRCSDSSRQSIIYSTVALEIALSCATPAADQAPASPSPLRL